MPMVNYVTRLTQADFPRGTEQVDHLVKKCGVASKTEDNPENENPCSLCPIVNEHLNDSSNRFTFGQ
jgi:hypothetical protein